MGVTVSNVMIVQCTIFRWNTRVWSRKPLILGHGVGPYITTFY